MTAHHSNNRPTGIRGGQRIRSNKVCRKHLLTNTIKDTLKVAEFLLELIANACEQEQEALLELKNDVVDEGALLILCYGAYMLKQYNKPLRLKTRDESCVFPIFEKHTHEINHLPASLRSKFLNQEGELLFRLISEHNAMLDELGTCYELLKREARATEEDLEHWITVLSEVTTNSFDHGIKRMNKNSPVFIMGTAAKNQVRFAHLDMGGGIPETIRERAEKEQKIGLNDADLIEYACQTGVSCRTHKGNRGEGLPMLVNLVNDTRGSLQIWSGNGLFQIKNRSTKKREIKPPKPSMKGFNGTFIKIEVNMASQSTTQQESNNG